MQKISVNILAIMGSGHGGWVGVCVYECVCVILFISTYCIYTYIYTSIHLAQACVMCMLVCIVYTECCRVHSTVCTNHCRYVQRRNA